MIYLKNYCNDFMFLVVMVCVTFSSTIVYFTFQFPSSFRYITVEIKSIHKFHQNECYLENERETKKMRHYIVDKYVTHTVTSMGL